MKKSKYKQLALQDWRQYQKRRKNPRDRSHQKEVEIEGHIFLYVGFGSKPFSAAAIKSMSAVSHNPSMTIIKNRSVMVSNLTLTYNGALFAIDNFYNYKCKKCNIYAVREEKHGPLKYEYSCGEAALKSLLG